MIWENPFVSNIENFGFLNKENKQQFFGSVISCTEIVICKNTSCLLQETKETNEGIL